MKKVLIIEDDPYVQRLYQRLFAHEDYTFEIASDGLEGLAKAKQIKPALILLDIIMPKKDGIQVLKELKADPEFKDTPIIILTNLGDEETVKKCLNLGADSFMIKANFEPEEVRQKIKDYFKE